MIKVLNRIIEYSFYSLFFLIPIVLSKNTSELFELNKMWLTWGLTIIITAAWLTKMVLQRKLLFQRTPLDIPIGLFLLSQIISTIFSLDVHVSVWGYYSRFNGGLLSIISYILLYYAFLSNFDSQKLSAITYKLLAISLISGLIVALWGLPSHFGYDPTCLLFRGTLDVSCWTADFMPTVRIFSTLGQPDWLAAYLAILIPIAIAFFINNLKSNSSNSQVMNHESGIMNYVLSKKFIHNSLFIILYSLFYVDLLFTRARSGALGIWIALIFFFTAYIFIKTKKLNFSRPTSPATSPTVPVVGRRGELAGGRAFLTSHLSFPICLLLLITFVIGTPIAQLRGFTLEGIKDHFQKPAITASNAAKATSDGADAQTQKKPIASGGGTESAHIRLYVWNGAINAWKNNPLFGTGVETFAFAYFKYKPAGQNLTSEWNFLYNKAHNEYLNYLATTGIFGLGTYLLMIGYFLFLSLKQFKANYTLDAKRYTLVIALLASYISILVTNFFGFSVVITNIYLFLIPAFVFVLTGILPENKSGIENHESRNLYQWTSIFFIILASLFMIQNLFQFWRADIAYALGYNLDRAGEYQSAYPHLKKAVELRRSEPIFKDELSVNNAIIAASLIAQKNQNNQDQTLSVASSLAQEAINLSNKIISQYQNNAVFWKTRVRVFYTLSQVDSRYLPRALDAIEKAALIAPNDANILYNLGVLYGQNSNITKGVEILEKTIQLKPDYRDAHYALGLFYRSQALDSTGKIVVNDLLNKKAIAQMQYILDNLSPNDSGALGSIKTWTL